jgi:2-dehydro-3-deoxygluconokinase
MADIFCLGEPMLEFNAQRPGADGRRYYLEGHGGDISNAAIAAARAGASVGMLTALGQDGPGESFMQLWAKEGVDTAQVIRNPAAPTGIYFVTHDARGHHFSFYRSGSAASLYGPPDVPEAAIRRAKYLHLSGISQAISTSACDAGFRAMEIARAAGVQISYDTNLRLRLWPAARAAAVIHAAIAMADIALPSLEDAIALTGLHNPDEICDFYLRLAPMVVLKCGAEGAVIATRESRNRIPACKVAALDATGAGDCFAGNFLSRLLAGDAPLEAARYANAAAALSTTGYGAVAPLPFPDAVRGLLEAR